MVEEGTDGIDLGGLMGFSGNHDVKVDAGMRALIPSPFKKELDRKFGPNQVLVQLLAGDKIRLLPFPLFEKIRAELEALPSLDPKAQAYRRYVLGNATACTRDAQSRIKLKPEFCEKLNIKKDATFVGVGEEIEIWSKKGWSDFDKKMSDNLDAVMTDIYTNSKI